MPKQNDELNGILTTFIASGWDLIDGPSRAWLSEPSEAATVALVAQLRRADIECGSCGCELDPLYKRALELLSV